MTDSRDPAELHGAWSSHGWAETENPQVGEVQTGTEEGAGTSLVETQQLFEKELLDEGDWGTVDWLEHSPSWRASHARLASALERARFWRSPEGQPRWARPALLAIAALCALTYSWGISNFPLEPFYGAAVRSMGSNWHDFFFGAVDPMGITTLDKLPGAFWVQALFVRALGFHYWVVCLPQVLAGVLTVLVLYRAVCRVAGPRAGLVAAGLIAVSPATALLNRGNVSDPLLVLLLVLAADAALRAALTGRPRSLLMCGLWVGLAFQTKMMEAWLVLPALLGIYLLASPATLRRRFVHVGATFGVVVVVSLSWMSIVSLVPSHDRPFVDGTSDDSVFTQVFVYNGIARVGIDAHASGLESPAETFLVEIVKHSPKVVGTFRIPRSWHRLLTGPLGRDVGWLLPASLIATLGIFLDRRRRGRRDPVRTAVLLWSGWLVIFFGFFSGGSLLNSYYTGILMPPMAALCAMGLRTAWQRRESTPSVYLWLVLAMLVNVAYEAYLIPPGAGIRWWLLPLGIGLAILACAACDVAAWRVTSSSPDRDLTRVRRPTTRALGAALLACMAVPAVVTFTVPLFDLGSFATPLQTREATKGTVLDAQRYQTQGYALGAQIDREYSPGSIVAANDTVQLSDGQMMVSGREFLPIGGYGGSEPAPSLSTLKSLVRSGRLHFFQVPVKPPGHDPRIQWVRDHCDRVHTYPYGPITLGTYNCFPNEVNQLTLAPTSHSGNALPTHGTAETKTATAIPSRS